MAPSTCQYQPLSGQREIRLLKLRPGLELDGISCELIHVDLDGELDFEAISYVWGDQTSRREVICGSQTLSITASLHCALVRLRCESEPRIVWADAICKLVAEDTSRQ
jgi:hypothetical protein